MKTKKECLVFAQKLQGELISLGDNMSEKTNGAMLVSSEVNAFNTHINVIAHVWRDGDIIDSAYTTIHFCVDNDDVSFKALRAELKDMVNMYI